MNACKVPCKDCPFTTSSRPGWLGPYESPEDLHRTIMNEYPFPCHIAQGDKEVSWDECGEDIPLCAGALLYMHKNAKTPRNPELAKALKDADKSLSHKILSTPEFITHHKKFTHGT